METAAWNSRSLRGLGDFGRQSENRAIASAKARIGKAAEKMAAEGSQTAVEDDERRHARSSAPGEDTEQYWDSELSGLSMSRENG